MSIEINRIVKLFEDLQHGDCWIGNNFKETLHGITANRLTGSDNPPPFKDFLLPAELSDAGWKQTLHDFEAAYHSLRTALHTIKDEQLDKLTIRKDQTFYQLIMGCLQHDAYHLGQIMLLKK